MTDRPVVLNLVTGELREQLFPETTRGRLDTLAQVRWLPEGASSRIPESWGVPTEDVEIILATWGMPRLDGDLLERLPSLRMVAYGAGTVKGFVTADLFASGVVVTHAATVLAQSVGEWCLMVALAGQRRLMPFHEEMRRGGWKQAHVGHGHQLTGKRVGLVAMSQTARAFRPLLAPFHCEVGVYDPYLTEDGASALGVTRFASLHDLCGWADILSNHVPKTPETEGLIGATHLARLRDGALLINSARAGAIDQVAMIRELQSGRIGAALDVYPVEPAPPDDPLRQLPNVIVTPHVAGATWENRAQLGSTMVDEIERFVTGKPLRFTVSADRLATMA